VFDATYSARSLWKELALNFHERRIGVNLAAWSRWIRINPKFEVYHAEFLAKRKYSIRNIDIENSGIYLLS